MFTTASSLSNLNVPHLETRKALIVINMQKDSFYLEDDLFTCKNQEFVEALKPIIPRFREAGDIVWVQTELDPPAASSRKPGTADRKIYPLVSLGKK